MRDLYHMQRAELEDRLLKFSVGILDLSENMPNTKGSNHLCGQIVRSGTAPPLLYGEACSAESIHDFIHKMGIALKELRETRMCLRMIEMKKYIPDLKETINENDQLIRIFGSSINTARAKLKGK
jgi:four helix bundle protein